MPTTKTIGSAGGRDYSSIQTWHDAFATGGWVGECYNDSEFVVTSAINMTGKTTSATDYITLRCGAGQSFKDNANVQTNALKYNQTNGVGIRITQYIADVIDVDEDYTTLSGLQTRSNGTGSFGAALGFGNSGPVTHAVIENCLFEGFGASVIHPGGSAGAGTFRNLLVICLGSGASGRGVTFGYNPSGAILANCTFVRPSDLTTGDAAITSLGSVGTITIKNCAGFGFSSFKAGSATASGSNNCSDQTISFGTNNQASKTYTSQFVGTTNAGQDFRAKAGADLLNNGVTDTTDIPAAIDIVGTARPQGSAWDIGAWELVAAAASTSSYLLAFPLNTLAAGAAARAVLGLRRNATMSRRRLWNFLGW